MNHPQTTAQEIADYCENIGKYGCLAMCYAYCIGMDGELEFIKTVTRAIKAGYLAKDCTVLDAPKYLEYLSGHRFTVEKKPITTIDDIKELTPVAYSYGGFKHWVVVENGRIVFNSLENSRCVTMGKPVDSRVIRLK